MFHSGRLRAGVMVRRDREREVAARSVGAPDTAVPHELLHREPEVSSYFCNFVQLFPTQARRRCMTLLGDAVGRKKLVVLGERHRGQGSRGPHAPHRDL